ncbi:hypothetical protein ACFVFS_36675 [Kitasatospora sp. NPDC057692]|uniref:hypothetical protein n=1 Tax=Kitasatospora sp. NPDC057692 TaxID=3346215 RepID=UPI003688EE0B
METRTTPLSHRAHATDEERTTAPAGPGTWAAAVLVCLAAGAGPLIGFWSFAR